jgi:micrococcal nuclease
MSNTSRPIPRYVLLTLVSVLFIHLFVSNTVWVENENPESIKEKGTVVAVYDGDTIKVRFDKGLERKVRLIGIDAPEVDDNQDEKKLQALLAKRFAFYYLYRKTVELTYESEREDRYGRLLAYVWTEDGLFNEFILREGFARMFWAFSFALKGRFVQAQRTAQEQGRGFWCTSPYPVISAKDARNHIGRLINVRFACVQIRLLEGKLLKSSVFWRSIKASPRSCCSSLLSLGFQTNNSTPFQNI